MVFPCMILREKCWPKLYQLDWRRSSIPKFKGSIFFFSIWCKKYCPSPCLMPFKKNKHDESKFQSRTYTRMQQNWKHERKEKYGPYLTSVFQPHKLIYHLIFMLCWIELFELFVTCRLKHSIYPNFSKSFNGTTTDNSKSGWNEKLLITMVESKWQGNG